MGRLIDEDDVIALLSNHHFDDDKDNFDLLIHNLCKEVKCIPTAYDVDEVAEHLDDERNFWNDCRNHRVGEAKSRSYAHAIEIVKGGGIDAIRSAGKRE